MKCTDIIIVSLILLFSSCTKVVVSGDDVSGMSQCDVIGWNVTATDQSEGFDPITRALIENYDDLKNACTPLETQETEKIGLLGKYILGEKTKVVFDNSELWWWEKNEVNPYYDSQGNNSFWNYPGENIYWADNADYTFKAYFPKSKVELQPGSGADKLLIVYDTELFQYDLLVAHKALRSKSENPVNLVMKNALAALKFDFQFVEGGATDQLIACWLENKAENAFFTSSTLNYDGKIVWPYSTSNPVGSRIYYWEPITPLQISNNSAAVAYSTPASSNNGSIYTDNSGWLLIIPQSNSNAGMTRLCFKTSTGGSTVYSIDIPAYDFQPGYRYSYHVNMTSTGIDLKLSIADWNERKSSYEIDFNE